MFRSVQIIFRELVGSLLKSLNLKVFLKIVKVNFGDACRITTIFKRILNSIISTRNLRAP